LPELKAVLPNAVPPRLDIEGYVDQPSLRYGVTSSCEPLSDEGCASHELPTSHRVLATSRQDGDVAAQWKGAGFRRPGQ